MRLQVATSGAASARILHLGCGPEKMVGSIGVDVNPSSAADVIHDLDSFPYPFAGDSFDLIVCDHVLEHLANIPRTMDELHRLCAPAGRVEIRVPHFSSSHYYRDPTHKHPFTLKSFDYFVEGTPVSRFGYSVGKFRVLRAELPPPIGAGPVKREFYRLLNWGGDFYEAHLAFVLPRHLLYFELAPVK